MSRVSCWFLALSSLPLVGWAGEMPQASPQEVHIDPAGLARAGSIVRKVVDKKEYAGAVTLVARHGKVVDFKALGMADVVRSRPMKTETIFRIYSMTEPITTVAAMTLWEENKLRVDDPVSKYIPEMKNLRVYVGLKEESVPAQREITIRDLMRHTAGFSDGVCSETPVDRMYREQKLLSRKQPLSEFVTRLAKIPLLYQPGTQFHYSVATDVLSRVIEVVSDQKLDVVLEERVFKPLDMVDTAFYVPASKVDRFAANYGPGLTMIDDPSKSPYLETPDFLSGGRGLVSTARDYTRFCQMMLNDGVLDNARLLQSATVHMMIHNQLPEEVPMQMPAGAPTPKGLRFGLGFAVWMTSDWKSATPDLVSYNPVVKYFWGGDASTGFAISPKNDTVVVVMTQFKIGRAHV